MNINLLPEISSPFIFFKNQIFKHLSLSKRINAAVLPVFVILISLSLGVAIYKFLKHKTNAEASKDSQKFYKSLNKSKNNSAATNAEASKDSQELRKSLEEWKNDPAAKGDKETACRRILEAFDKKFCRLDLSFLGLTLIPEAINKLTQLESLELFNNQLQSLPESIESLTQLRKLYLINNQL